MGPRSATVAKRSSENGTTGWRWAVRLTIPSRNVTDKSCCGGVSQVRQAMRVRQWESAQRSLLLFLAN